MGNLLPHLISMSALLLAAWMLVKGPWIAKPSINAACEKCYNVLFTQILAVESGKDINDLESAIDDFWKEFGGKALNAERYKDSLYRLLTKVKYA